MDAFNKDNEGIAWLKIRAVERKDIQPAFISQCGLKLSGRTLNDRSKEIFALFLSGSLSIEAINTFLRSYSIRELESNKELFAEVESDLYKMREYTWGGDANNSLDKQIVSVIKRTPSYDAMVQKIDNEIHEEMRRYTLNSWYNNWSAILTENIFKEHRKVLSSVGKNKSVDFFIDDVPIDLKITFLPKTFMSVHAQKLGYKSKEASLKTLAKKCGIKFDCSSKSLEYQLTQQLKDLGKSEIDAELTKIQEQQKDVIASASADKIGLIKWLYENQGTMRFGAENRIYIVLTDTDNVETSWRLKRNLTLLRKNINEYLDNFDRVKFLKDTVSFVFNAKAYTSCSDVIHVMR